MCIAILFRYSPKWRKFSYCCEVAKLQVEISLGFRVVTLKEQAKHNFKLLSLVCQKPPPLEHQIKSLSKYLCGGREWKKQILQEVLTAEGGVKFSETEAVVSRLAFYS